MRTTLIALALTVAVLAQVNLKPSIDYLFLSHKYLGAALLAQALNDASTLEPRRSLEADRGINLN